MYCKTHAKSEMVDVKNARCSADGCDSISPSFNWETEKRGKFCKLHADPKMVNVRSRHCVFNKCNRHPTHNFEGKIKALYCAEHALQGMLNITHRRCENVGCNKLPSYGHVHENKMRFCARHFEPGMKRLKKSESCTFENCESRASFGFKSDRLKQFCKKHASATMVNLNHLKSLCHEPHCTTRALFNYKGQSKAKFCKQHSSAGMMDVTRKLCAFNACNKRPEYNVLRESSVYCRKHAKPNMIRRPTLRCELKKCKEFAMYGDTKRARCDIHKLESDTNLAENQCSKCGLFEILNAEGICIEYCAKPRRRQLVKQNRIKRFLDSNKFEYISSDRRINNGECGLERPDFIFDCGSHFLILEVDEHQHQSYNCECEIRRMINIHSSLGVRYCVFIRYNPDAFKVQGVSQSVPENKRIEKLSKWIIHFLNCSPTDFPSALSVIYLFYDDFEEKLLSL